MKFKIKHILAKAVFGAGFALLVISSLYGHFIPDSKTVVIVAPGAEPDTSSLDFMQSIEWLLIPCLFLAGYAAASVFELLWEKGRLILAFPATFGAISVGFATAVIFAAFAGGGELKLNFPSALLCIVSAAVMLWAPSLDIAKMVLGILDRKK